MFECAFGKLRLPVDICLSHKWCLSACLCLMLTYGVGSIASETHGPPPNYFAYGWPLEYAWQESHHGGWYLFSAVYDFRLKPFVFDLLLALVSSTFFTHLWHYHRLRHKGWQFSVREMLALVFVVSLLTGTYTSLRLRFERDNQHLSELDGAGWGVYMCGTYLPWYVRPIRDIGLTSEDDWTIYGVEWNSDLRRTDGGNINQSLCRLSSQPLTFVDYVAITDPELDDDGIRFLCNWASNCPCIRLVGCANVSDVGIAYMVDHLTNLRELELRGTRITDCGIQAIGSLRQLECLSVTDLHSATTVRSLHNLLTLPRLKQLEVPCHWKIDGDSQEELKRRQIETVVLDNLE